MRFVDYIRLYKTPLDSTYSNVYDDYSAYSDYITFLSAFPHIDISLEDSTSAPMVKSRKDTNGVFDLVVGGFDSMDLHDYNYMLFWIRSQNAGDIQSIPKFAFITSVESLNDGGTSKASLLTCKLDTWSNHYLELKTTKVTSSVERLIIANYTGQNYTGDTKLIKIPSKIESVAFALCQTFYNSNGKLCTIIWERFQLSEKARTPLNTRIRSACYEGNGIYVYKIAGVLNLETRELIDYTFTHGGDTYAVNSKELNLYSNVSTSDYVLSVDLTVWAPFPYSVENGVLTLPANLAFNQYGYFNEGVFYEECSGFTRSNVIRYDGGSKTIILNSLSAPTVTGIQNLVNDNVFLYRYPFYYYSIFGNGLHEVILPPDNSTSITILVKFEGRLYPEIFINKAYVDVTNKIIIQRLPSMYLEYDENANYLRNNQNKLLLTEHYLNISNIIAQTGAAGNMGMAFLGMGIKDAPTNVLGAMDNSLKSLYSLHNFYATREDMKYKRGSVINGETASHFLTLDEIVIYKNNAYEYNKYETAEIAKDLAYNGVPINGSFNVLDKNRSRYDFCICKNPIISIALNDSDKFELVRAFRNGLRRWHITVPSYTFDVTQRNQ